MSPAISPAFRPRDKMYSLFLLNFILTIIFFDLIPVYPPNIVPAPLLSAHAWYKMFFNDQLVITQPAWFRFFTFVEGIYLLPAATWSVWALSTKSSSAPAHMLVWASVSFGTTITCLYEFYENNLMSEREKIILFLVYGSYCLIFGVIGTDMFCRIQKTMATMASRAEDKKIK